MKLSLDTKPKVGIFQKTDGCFFDSLQLRLLSMEVEVSNITTDNSAPSFSVDNCFSVSSNPRPAYEWVAPSSATTAFSSSASLMRALLAASDATLEVSSEKSDSVVLNVLVSVYELDHAGFGRSAAQEVMLFVEKKLKQNALIETNRFLELADTSRLSSRSLVGLVRSTSRLKDRLPAWEKTYFKSREQVSKQGKNPDTLFVGLPKVTLDATKATR
jgi:hypothetical protein